MCRLTKQKRCADESAFGASLTVSTPVTHLKWTGRWYEMNMQIAICDDDVFYAERLNQYVKSLCSKLETALTTSVFHSARALWYEVSEGNQSEYRLFDVYLLDIEMRAADGMDGMELARRISADYPQALLIFISSHTEYVFQGYETRAFRFIPKDRLSELLPAALKDAAREITRRERGFYIAENQSGIRKIPLKDVVYISRDGKYSVFQMCSGEAVRVRATLKTVCEELEHKGFAVVERGYICNLEMIDHTEGEAVIMKDNTRFVVHRGRIEAFRNLLRVYWINREDMY